MLCISEICTDVFACMCLIIFVFVPNACLYVHMCVCLCVCERVSMFVCVLLRICGLDSAFGFSKANALYVHKISKQL